jgi:hypothetical protein
MSSISTFNKTWTGSLADKVKRIKNDSATKAEQSGVRSYIFFY